MKARIKSYLLMIFTIILFIGCSENNNPVDPNDTGSGDGEIEIKTPKTMSLTKIILTRFPSVKSNGEKWDYHVFSNSPTRRPDIYVELYKSGSSNYLYKSDTKEDAILETSYSSYSFNKAGSTNGKSLPQSLSYNQLYKIKIFDDDGLSSNDSMSEFSIKASSYYNDDNATHLYKTLTVGSYTLKIEGRWNY